MTLLILLNDILIHRIATLLCVITNLFCYVNLKVLEIVCLSPEHFSFRLRLKFSDILKWHCLKVMMDIRKAAYIFFELVLCFLVNYASAVDVGELNTV